jgi:hypothetical protein
MTNNTNEMLSALLKLVRKMTFSTGVRAQHVVQEAQREHAPTGPLDALREQIKKEASRGENGRRELEVTCGERRCPARPVCQE